jgi:hypothetical protein
MSELARNLSEFPDKKRVLTIRGDPSSTGWWVQYDWSASLCAVCLQHINFATMAVPMCRHCSGRVHSGCLAMGREWFPRERRDSRVCHDCYETD